MTIAIDARFMSRSGVHPHSRFAHILLRQNRLTPYPARIVLYTDNAAGADGLESRYRAPNVSVKVLGPVGGRWQRLWWLVRSLPTALQRDSADLFYSSFYFLPPRVRGVRLINNIHDCCVFYIDPKLNRGLLSSPAYLRVLRPYMMWTNRRADCTITDSRFSKEMLHRHLGLPLDSIRVCYHGLETDLPVSRRSPASDGAGPYFLFVGSNLPKKNIRQCIAGFARLPAAIRETYKLCLKTSCYPENRAQIEQLGLADRVEFISGHLDESAMESLFRGATLVLLLSYDEGFGLPIIEAFAANVPVLVSNRAACGELVSMAECKADPDDTEEIAAKWLALVTDQELRGRCLAEQQRLLPRFSCRVAADAFFEALVA